MSRVKLGNIAVEVRETVKDPSGLPVVGLEHLNSDELELTTWSENSDNTFTRRFRKGQILFGRRRAYQKKAAVATIDGVCSGDITVIAAKEERILADLLPFVIHDDRLFDFAMEKSAGSLSPRVKWEQLAEYELELPDFDEQKRLAKLLWAVERTKKAYRKLLDKSEELVKSQFVEMFGDYKTNPKGWPIEPFSTFATIDAEMTTDYEKYADYPHIGIDSIERDTGILSGYRTVKEDNVISGKYIFTPEHIIYSKIRPNLNKVALPDFTGLCSADAYPILPNADNCNRIYLAVLLRSEYFLSYILGFSARSNMPKVNRRQISGFKAPLPPLPLQVQFAEFNRQTDKSKLEMKKALESLNLAQKALLTQCLG